MSRKMGRAICITILILAFTGSFLLGYGEQAKTIFAVTPEEFDFGTIEEGKAATVTATVENVADMTVDIKNVRTN